MRGTLRVVDASGDREVELERGANRVGGGNGAAAIPLPEAEEEVCVLEWEARRGTWLLRRSGSTPAAVNGRPVQPAEPLALNDLDVIETAGALLQFQRHFAPPEYGGAPVEEVPLGDGSLTLGSARESTPDPHRIELDADDLRISRVHAAIVREGDEYFLEDHSSLGSELNGVGFQRERLVFGDRFRISGYIFEFTGHSIRRIEPAVSGSIVARDLAFVAGGRRILDGVSVSIAAGEFVGVLGRSGQGKSTLLNALCGVQPAHSGETRIGGVALADRAALRALGIGYVPQDDIVHRELTVLAAVSFTARLRLRLPPRQLEALVQRTLDRLGLLAHLHKRVAQLSGGQRKRVSIAIELLAKPSVLFLDEPSSGLDPATEAELMTLLQSLTLTKLTVVCTTHVLHKAYLFDRMLLIEGGKLIFAGRGDEARLHFLLSETAEGTGSLENTPLERIYTVLQEEEKNGRRNAADWEAQFRESAFAARACPLVPGARTAEAAPTRLPPRVGFATTLRVLGSRQWSILRADPLNLAFLAAQPLLIGALVGWVAEEAALRMFLCIVATMWFGCSNGAQQIVSELPIFRRERVCGLGLHSYILSKLGFLSAISLGQAILLLFATLCFARLFHAEKVDTENLARDFARRLTPIEALAETQDAPPESFDVVDAQDAGTPAAAASPSPPPPQPRGPRPWAVRALLEVSEFFQITQNVLDTGPRPLKQSDGSFATDGKGREIMLPGMSVTSILATTLGLRLAAIVGAALVSVSIGLTISSLVTNTTQAVLWVPLVLIPQILFGGIVVAVPDMAASVRYFSQAMPSFAAQRIMDVAAIFGIDTPALGNRTKTPVFLSSLGEKETIEWPEGGDTRSQDYDKLSPMNAAWQNLAVIPARRGQHKWVQKPVGEGDYTYPDSVETRRDVALRKGMPFRDLTAYFQSTAVLLGWMAVCYGAMLAGLRAKQTGS
jgi:ABC-type multidrug transport system ATPase subunit